MAPSSSASGPRLSCAIYAPWSPRSYALATERARLAESLGYHVVYTQHGTWDALAAAGWFLAGTSTIRVGSGIVPIYARPPTAMALEAATMAVASGYRFNLGLGLSTNRAGEEVWGVPMGDPLEDMRDYVRVVRALLDGEASPRSERWSIGPYRIWLPRAADRVPIYLAALGTGMARLAGEIADGLITWMAPVEWVRDAVVPAATEGRAKVGKTLEGFDVVVATPTAVTADLDNALHQIRKQAARYFSADHYRAMLMRAGFGDDIQAFDAATTDEEGLSAVSRRFIASYAVVGTPDDVRDAVTRRGEVGATTVMLVPIYNTPFNVGLRAAAESI